MSPLKDCTAVVLCGGKSIRMGFDKALLQMDGEYVLLRTTKQLKKLFSEVILGTNDREKFPAAFSEELFLEDVYREQGPLGGLVTALESSKTEVLFLMACDIPAVASDLIQKMFFYTKKYEVVICRQNNTLEPLFAFYHRSCLPVFKQQLTTKDWRIRKEFKHFSVKVIELEECVPLRNVNTPKELPLWKHGSVYKRGV